MHPKYAEGIANSEDPDQTASSLGTVWSWSTLFAQTCLSENFGNKLLILQLKLVLRVHNRRPR